MLSFSLLFIIVFLGIAFIITSFLFKKKKNINFGNSTLIKNMFINIGLLTLSGILFLIYEKIFNNIFSVSIGIIIVFYILFTNLIGIIFSIKYSKKILIILINYCAFIISTIITYNLLSITIKLLENNNIIPRCSGIIYLLILILGENIFSYLIIKRIEKINNKSNRQNYRFYHPVTA